ncbi:hypothetical protein BSKO_06088 [Bryopsis sp. KO-2023]|nr:hypothetical protein BSKO_06088 [Bryopsis sp. KO-2023]
MDEFSHAPSDIGKDGRYHVVRAFGRYGRVKMAYDRKDKKLVAIRFIERKSETNLDYIQREILSRRALFHHHIIRFHEVFLSPDALCIVMGYAPGGTLLDFVTQHRYLNEDWARRFFQQLIIAVAYNQHRDVTMNAIRLDKLVLNGNQQMISLCDMNLKGAFDSPPAFSAKNPYSPPEIEPGYPKPIDTKKRDVFCCGVCLYYMLFGQFPSIGKPGMLRTPEHLKRTESKTNLSPDCTNFLSWILNADPQQRPTVDEIIQCPWFQKDLPEGTEEYNERLKDVREDVIEAAFGLQSKSEIRSVIRRASANRKEPTESFKCGRNEDSGLYRWIQRSGCSLKCRFMSQLQSKENKHNYCVSAVQRVRKSISRTQRLVQLVSY